MKQPILILALWLLGMATANAYSLATTLPRTDVMRLVAAEAARQDFSSALALAVAEVESDFRTRAESHAGARGVMQIMPATGRSEFGLSRHQLWDPRTNIRTGIRYLKQLMGQYGSKEIALSHYNGGSAVRRPDGSLRVIPATRDYVARVLQKENDYVTHPLATTGASVLQVADNRDTRDHSHSPYSRHTAERYGKADDYAAQLRELRRHNAARARELGREASGAKLGTTAWREW